MNDHTVRPASWDKNAHLLLGDLMTAFGWDPERMQAGPATKRMLGAIPADPELRRAAYRREFDEAEPLLRELVQRAEALRSWPLRKPDAYEHEWRSIIETWNGAIRARGWLEMPPFCEVCGKPMQRYATWRSPKEPGKPQLSFCCSERCRGTKRQRAHRERAKLNEPAAKQKRQPQRNRSTAPKQP